MRTNKKQQNMQRITSLVLVKSNENDRSKENPWSILNQTVNLKNYLIASITKTLVIMSEEVWDAIEDKNLLKDSIIAVISSDDEIHEQEEHKVSKIGSTLKEIIAWTGRSHPYANIIVLGTMNDIEELQSYCKFIHIICTNGHLDVENPLLDALSFKDEFGFSDNELTFRIKKYEVTKPKSVSDFKHQEAEELDQ